MINKELYKTKHIQAYNLAEFCQDVKQAFEEGFTFDFDTNENYPTSFGTFYSATMVPAVLKIVEAQTRVVESATSRMIDTAVVNGKLIKEALVEAAEELSETVDANVTKSTGRPKKG